MVNLDKNWFTSGTICFNKAESRSKKAKLRHDSQNGHASRDCHFEK